MTGASEIERFLVAHACNMTRGGEKREWNSLGMYRTDLWFVAQTGKFPLCVDVPTSYDCSCLVYDCGSRGRDGTPRALWYGLEFVRYTLSKMSSRETVLRLVGARAVFRVARASLTG
ncbi:hypothetical protein Vafri_21771 [Volvox africanus]|uniref:Uncharacterized protein n=1 Tax=Volvox africanus TaxID=51714 RepID=A0A8J4BT58_9CHLO|nr:hypothetical protein Vafri_21771 [Volvox africanus]